MNEAKHGNGHADRLEDFDPDVGKSRTKAVLAIHAADLGKHGNDGEEDANETILEDADPNDLTKN